MVIKYKLYYKKYVESILEALIYNGFRLFEFHIPFFVFYCNKLKGVDVDLSSLDYRTPIITRKRKGDHSDPFIKVSESHQIENGIVNLTEIPYEVDRVIVTGNNITWYEKTISKELKENEFTVDYQNGLVKFHPSRNGLTLQFIYKGTGLRYIPTGMIYTKENNGQVVETLNNVIEQSQGAIQNANTVIDRVNAEIDRLEKLDVTTLEKKVGNLTTDVNSLSSQLAQKDRQTQIIQHGLSVLNADVSSPVDLEINGRSLVNLNAKSTVKPNTITLDSTKYYLLINDNKTAVKVDTVSQTVPYKFTGKATVALDWTTGKVALYEIDKETYDKIGISLMDSDVERMFPYVDSMQHLSNPVITAEGENLIPPFTEWNLHPNAKVINPYELELNATANYQDCTYTFDAIPNKFYTLSLGYAVSGNSYFFAREFNAKGEKIAESAVPVGQKTITFTVSETTKKITIFTGNIKAGTFTFKNPMLTLGSTVKPFTPKNPTYLYADIKLGQIGDKKDILSINGTNKTLTKWIEKDAVLDGSLTWTLENANSQYKRLMAIGFGTDKRSTANQIATDYKGNLIASIYTMDSESAFLAFAGGGIDNLYITISNSNSGWVESMTPTPDEIKAYFNGWQVKTADANGKPTAWKSLADGVDSPTQTLTYVKANRAPNYTPYKLSYVLAKPEIIDVSDKVEGDIVVNGLTQISVDSGVILREKTTPVISVDFYYINNKNLPSSLLKYAEEKYYGVYKNGVEINNYTVGSLNGRKHEVQIKKMDFDPSAEYTVTYQTSDKHTMTCNATEVKATYSKNIRGAVDDMNNKLSDAVTDISINNRSIIDLYIKIKALGG